jgi:hypothetical protein
MISNNKYSFINEYYNCILSWLIYKKIFKVKTKNDDITYCDMV